MLNQKQRAFKNYVKALVDSMEVNDYVTMPKPCEEFSILLGTNRTAVFIYKNQVLDPVTWLKEICGAFDSMLAGMASKEDEIPYLQTFDTYSIGIYSSQENEVLDFISEFTDAEVEGESDNGVFRVLINSKFTVLSGIAVDDEEGTEIDTIVYEFSLCDSTEQSDMDDELDEEDFEDEDLDDEDEIVEREDLIISGTITLTGGTFADANKVTFNDPHKDIAHEVASLVSEKQKAYGNSVDKVQRVIEIMMEQYDNGDGTYTVPKELIPHLLYQVRIMDKQNRIFTNPEADLMDESPYTDILGYALLMLAKLKEEN